MPQPTSRTLAPSVTREVSSRSRIRLIWACSLVSLALDSGVGQ